MAQKKPLTEQERYPDQFFSSPAGHIRDRIIIHESQKIPREGLFISLNGFSFLAKPGVEIDLPRPVRLMLDTRVETETIQADDGMGGMKEFTRNIPRVTYTLIKEGVNIPDPVVIDNGGQAEDKTGTDPFE
jgi:hypothetical protein